MENQILAAYAAKHAATAEIAEMIGQVLRQAGLRTDVLPADRVSDVSPYKAVVLGSAGIHRPLAKRGVEIPEGEG